MRPYLYLLFACDGDLCGLDMSEDAAEVGVAVGRGCGLLKSASDVHRVEIWRDGALFGSVGRA